jgi:hypothetical protein
VAQRRSQRTGLSDDHKAALVAGRAEARIVRDYLTALREHRPRPGRKRTPESVRQRLQDVEEELAKDPTEADDPLLVLELIQARIDLTAELAGFERSALPALEDRFVEVASAYARRKGVTYEAWRELGVSAVVLRRAGIRPDSA